MTTFIILGTLVFFIVLGVPIALALGVTAVGFYVIQGDLYILPMVPQRMFSATTSFTLLAIPFFILAGNLLNPHQYCLIIKACDIPLHEIVVL